MDNLINQRDFITGIDTLNIPMEALWRCTSNPLIRGVSDVSCTSQEGGATFVPFGRTTDPEYLANNIIVPKPKAPITNDLKQCHPGTVDHALIGERDPKPQIQSAVPSVPSFAPKHFDLKPVEYDKKPIQIRKKTRKTYLSSMSITDLIPLNLSLKELLDHGLICRFFCDQNGSRYVQDKLISNGSSSVIDNVLKHIIFDKKEIVKLSNDVYGNYVIQILFEIGSKSQRKLLIEYCLKGNVYRLSHSFYGCRVIQKAFDCIEKDESISLILELKNNSIKGCIIGQNSNHVLQKILSLKLDMKYIEFVINCIKKDIYLYSSHIFGCRIVQVLINNYGSAILDNIVNDNDLIFSLSKSEYGNYVIQDILALKDGYDMQSIVRLSVFKNVVLLSKNKFGSNVVETCLVSSTEKEREFLLKQIMKHKAILTKMVQDKYANYVIQKLLIYSSHKQQSKLIYLIEKNIPNLRSLNYGKHIMDKIRKIKNKYKSKRIYH